MSVLGWLLAMLALSMLLARRVHRRLLEDAETDAFLRVLRAEKRRHDGWYDRARAQLMAEFRLGLLVQNPRSAMIITSVS